MFTMQTWIFLRFYHCKSNVTDDLYILGDLLCLASFGLLIASFKPQATSAWTWLNSFIQAMPSFFGGRVLTAKKMFTENSQVVGSSSQKKTSVLSPPNPKPETSGGYVAHLDWHKLWRHGVGKCHLLSAGGAQRDGRMVVVVVDDWVRQGYPP